MENSNKLKQIQCITKYCTEKNRLIKYNEAQEVCGSCPNLNCFKR